MREITKGAEPASLVQHRATQHCDYDNYVDKDGLRVSLVAEQRGICCYCMGRIRSASDAMKIEHWQCQSRHPTQQLVYRNLLGACLGGEGQPRAQQHCDARKGDDDLKWNPAEPGHQIEVRVVYDPDGTIRSANADFDGQLKTVLNLNLERLKGNRAAVLTGILDWWKASRPVPRDRLEREMQRHAGVGTGGDLEPYSAVAVWWLRRKLEKVAQ